MQYLWAFLVGGALCVIGQILIDKTSLTPARRAPGRGRRHRRQPAVRGSVLFFGQKPRPKLICPTVSAPLCAFGMVS